MGIKLKFPKIPYWPLLVVPTAAFALGFLMNAIVMAANGSTMPVAMPFTLADVLTNGFLVDHGDMVHSVMTPATRLKFLADWVVINHFGIASPGDFFEWFCELTQTPAAIIWAALIIKDHNKV